MARGKKMSPLSSPVNVKGSLQLEGMFLNIGGIDFPVTYKKSKSLYEHDEHPNHQNMQPQTPPSEPSNEMDAAVEAPQQIVEEKIEILEENANIEEEVAEDEIEYIELFDYEDESDWDEMENFPSFYEDYASDWEENFSYNHNKLWSRPSRKGITRNKLRPSNDIKKDKHISHVNASRKAAEERRSVFQSICFSNCKSNSFSLYGNLITARPIVPASGASATASSTRASSSRPNHNHQNDDVNRAIDASLREFYATTSNINGISSQLLQDLQNRDLTPEDYELLLLLDTTVKPKTLSAKTIDKFPTRVILMEDLAEATRCTVCMCDYECGDMIKTLPCGHYFHIECITQWLTGSSINCPIDGLAVS